MSLSARRAWIEICGGACARRLALVALRKESVDRNSGLQAYLQAVKVVALRKESVDRNPGVCIARTNAQVALRKESVDRNFGVFAIAVGFLGRSPQGERG